MKIIFLFITLLIGFTSIAAQDSKKGLFNIKKIGFLYNNANDKNFIFDDKDFSYSTNTYKLQAFYDLGTWKSLKFELILQPQMQILEHQLLNKQFVLPTEENYQEKRTEFTTPKTMHLYAFELGFVIKKKILNKLDYLMKMGLGLATINTRTERLAKGFTFIENASLGLSYNLVETTFLFIGSNIGHVSNLDTQKPNNGYSFVGFEVGISYIVK
mgnify:FL=1|jgi:hypothetical protein|tara:strand:- start:1911 stop:2552 length:642 start_codon:yes stop_codon:yes gene_type:complete